MKKSQTIYVIWRDDGTVGLFSNILVFLGHIAYAAGKGYLPVIDLQSHRNTLLTEEEVGKVNGWEYFFEQPCGIGLPDISQDRTVLSSSEVRSFSYPWIYNLHNYPGEIKRWHTLYQQYIRLNEPTRTYINDQYSRLISNKDRVLGVLLRGTDYIQRKPYGHPIQPDTNSAISKCLEIMEKQNCNKLFLATEDSGCFNAFSEVFKDDLITTSENILYENTNGQLLSDIRIGLHRERFIRALDYLSKIVILSRCTCLAAGQTSGSVGALIMSEGFEYKYLWDLGRYGLEDTLRVSFLKFAVKTWFQRLFRYHQ